MDAHQELIYVLAGLFWLFSTVFVTLAVLYFKDGLTVWEKVYAYRNIAAPDTPIQGWEKYRHLCNGYPDDLGDGRRTDTAPTNGEGTESGGIAPAPEAMELTA